MYCIIFKEKNNICWAGAGKIIFGDYYNMQLRIKFKVID